MIGKALKKIVEGLNDFLATKYPNSINSADYCAEIQNIQKSTDPLASDPAIKVALINIEEDKVYKNHLKPSNITNGEIHPFGGTPVMRVNFYILFAFNPKPGQPQQQHYLDSLSLLTHVLSYFTATPYQEIAIPLINPDKEFRLEINYHNVNLEDSNNMWSNLGGEQKPYAMYQIKMLEIEADTSIAVVNDKVLQVAPIISSPNYNSFGETIFIENIASPNDGKPENDTNEIKNKKN